MKTGGTYSSTLDDKGRVSIPIKLRDRYAGELVVTMGLRSCARIMTAEVWNQMYERWTNAEGLTEDEQESVAYQFIAPATPVEVDKTGRMAIPPHIRRYAKLSKDCLVLNLVNWLEVWDEELFFAHVEENRPETKEVMKKMGSLKLFKVD